MCKKEKLNTILLSSKEVNRDEILDIIPELSVCVGCTQNHPAHIYDVFTHTIKVVEGLENNLILKLTGILHDIGKYYTKKEVDGIERFWGHEEASEKLAYQILSRLEYDIATINKVCTLIKYHDKKIKPVQSEVEQAVEEIGIEMFPLLLKHQKADLYAHSPDYIKKKAAMLETINEIYTNINK